MNDSVRLMRALLRNEGIEDPEILQRTPERWVNAFRAMMGTGHPEWDFTTFDSTATDMVIVGPIEFSSMCSHHLLPFFGKAWVAYIPQGRVAGLSKLARTVKTAALGLWSQEELCEEIMHQLERGLSWAEDAPNTPNEHGIVKHFYKPLGVGVVMKAEHTCMTVRGVKSPGALTITSSMCGVFRENGNGARQELMALIK